MSKKNKNESEYMQTNKQKSSFLWIIILFIAILIISFYYVKYIKELVYKNINNNITELSEQTAAQLNLSITDQKNFVKIMVDLINRGYFETTTEIFDRFKDDLENYHFTRLVILDKKGNGVTSDEKVVKNYANIEEFFDNKEEVYLSENRPSTVSNNQVNIYSKTFKLKGEERVLMATINTEDYKEILLRRLFDKGGTYLINNNGHILIDTFDEIKDNNTNLYNHLKSRYVLKQEDINKINTMAQDIKKHQVGNFNIKFDKETYFIHYEKVNINDWYVVTIISDNTIAKELITLLVISFCLCLVIISVIISISIYINISNQKKNYKLYQVAYIDPITSLGNDDYFKENGTKYLNNSVPNKYIISLDINKFKALNNIYGYEFCNKILKILGEKLTKVLPKDNITCRISSDIFVTIFSYEDNIHELLNKIFHQISKFRIDETEVTVNLAIGVYKVENEDKDINKILDKAYMARAKIKGFYHDNYYIFDEILENQLIEEQKIEAYMKEALKNHEFKVVYQPKIYTQTEKLAGAEALVRWIRDGKVISPNKFIPLFEKNKFIIKLDLYIFEQVCKDIASWKQKYNFTPTISINVSKEHFANENFIEEYVKIVDRYDVDREKIDLEITESATIEEKIDILKIMNKIKEKGFILSIDDFGTGYSSLSMLQSMPIDIIKIDKIFVDKADLKSDKNIINYIMLIAKHLEVKTIIEGVETKEQVDFVKRLEGDIIQGYYYFKPILKDEFEKYFNKNK
ncbi:MAG: EAL domain-containing protein [Clostridia bacterium]|jgi:diguanylate cyclase (GGDEF)-like protein|nr:EAL domain-containing protein [Clostridia bacterium]